MWCQMSNSDASHYSSFGTSTHLTEMKECCHVMLKLMWSFLLTTFKGLGKCFANKTWHNSPAVISVLLRLDVWFLAIVCWENIFSGWMLLSTTHAPKIPDSLQQKSWLHVMRQRWEDQYDHYAFAWIELVTLIGSHKDRDSAHCTVLFMVTVKFNHRTAKVRVKSLTWIRL